MLILVRHGETAVNTQGRLQGRVETALTERGREQAARLATAVASFEPVGLVSSPLRRAQETAEAIGAATGLDVEIDERLTELHYGDWEGSRFGDLPEGTFDTWRGDPAFAPPGGESLVDLRTRVVPCIEELLGHERPVVAVSHVSPIKAAVTWALGVGDEATWRMHLNVASISRIDRRPSGGAPLLAAFNETAHLHE
ncbi:MAG: histidine phosphatase family protein [Acidimicrobiia bacterium]